MLEENHVLDRDCGNMQYMYVYDIYDIYASV